jgi:MFS family permease
MSVRASTRFFYGWWIVAASFVTLFVATGFIFYSYGIFLEPLQAEFGASRFAVALGLTLMNAAMAFFAPFLGRFIDTWSIRKMMMIGCISLGVGFLIASQITELWQWYVLIGTLLAFGICLIGQLSSTALVANWFVRRRGAALGIATTGVSMSGMVMAPVTSYLITHFGWRHTFLIFGGLSLAGLLPLVWAFVISRPEDIGLHPDGARTPPPDTDPAFVRAAPQPMRPSFSTAATLRSETFWAITLSIGLNFFAMAATLIHLIEHARDLDISRTQAAYIMTASAGVGVIGKILFGYIADFVDARLALVLCLAFQALGTTLLLFADSYAELMAVGAVFGFGMGGVVPLWGSLVGDYFPRPVFGRVMGLMSPCMLPIQASGVPLAGYIHDVTGDYHLAFMMFTLAYIFAALCLMFVRNPLSGPTYARHQAQLRAAIRAGNPLSS